MERERSELTAVIADLRRSRFARGLECPHCHEMKLPHRVCPNCGYYQGRLAVPPKPVSSSGDADR